LKRSGSHQHGRDRLLAKSAAALVNSAANGELGRAPGTNRVDALLVGEDDDEDGEVRLASKDWVFSLRENGPVPPEATTHNRDVAFWRPFCLPR
jgi:hypothetical protein